MPVPRFMDVKSYLVTVLPSVDVPVDVPVDVSVWGLVGSGFLEVFFLPFLPLDPLPLSLG